MKDIESPAIEGNADHLADHLREKLNFLQWKVQHGEHVPFRIEEIKERGFLVKVCGLFAFVAFRYMPWYYSDLSVWPVIFPLLKGKVLFGRVHSITISERIFILLDGKVHVFKKYDLEHHTAYRGIVSRKSDYGVFVELGHLFDWKCGSIEGLKHRSQFGKLKYFNEVQVGDKIEVYFLGMNADGQPCFGNARTDPAWYNGTLEAMTGQSVPVKVRNPYKMAPELLVNGRFRGIIPDIDKKKMMCKALNQLPDTAVILCRLVGLNKKRNKLNLEWLATDIEAYREAVLLSLGVQLSSGVVLSEKALINRIDEKVFLQLTGQDQSSSSTR